MTEPCSAGSRVPAGLTRRAAYDFWRRVTEPPAIPDGTLEALKWLALALMLLDHVNKYLLGHGIVWGHGASRIAFPIFAFVLAANLARGEAGSGAPRRVIRRLAIFGLLATPAHAALLGSAMPLNILFTLMAAVVVTAQIQRGTRAAPVVGVPAVLVGSLLCDYFLPGLAMCIAANVWCRSRSPWAWACWVGGIASLAWINNDQWALAAIPLLLLASRVELTVPRRRWLFYAFYPAHLGVIWAAQYVLR